MAGNESVHQHLVGTAALCRAFSSPWGRAIQGEWLGLLHDIGKYSQAFQKRLLLNNGPQVDHATAGAYESFIRQQLVAAFCIAGHTRACPTTAAVPTWRERPYGAPEQGQRRSWSHTRPGARRLPSLMRTCLRSSCKTGWLQPFYTRMMYSCLVDADFLDTEAFMAEEEVLRAVARICQRWRKAGTLYRALVPPPKGALNRQRCAILRACIEGGEGSRPGLFSLPCRRAAARRWPPLAFALKHARANGLKRIVYVIPLHLHY